MILSSFRLEFDIAGLILLISLFRFYADLLKINDRKAKFFFFYTIFAALYLFSEIAQVFVINKSPDVSRLALNLVNYVFYTFHFLMGIYFLAYSMMMFTSAGIKINVKQFIAFSAVGIIAVLALLINPFYPWLFEINENKEYVHGTLHVLSYIIPLLYVLGGALEILIHRKMNTKNKLWTIIISAVILFGAAGFQYIYDEEITTGFAVALGILFVFISFHDPNEQIDSLTGLLNKESFTSEMTEKIGKNKKPYIYVIALNNFTKINTTYGNAVGDQVLNKAAHILAKVSPLIYNYRYGGDKFVGFTSSEIMTRETVNAFKAELSKGIKLDGFEIEISARYAVIPAELIDDLQYLIRQIDFSVVESKKKAHLAIYELNKDINKRLKALVAEEKDIHNAIESGEFEIYYQPIINKPNSEFSKAEALLRVKDRGGNFINPETVISYAEKKGLMLKLGNDIIKKVFSFISDSGIRKLGVDKIAINLSMIQCIQPHLANKIINLARDYRIVPSLIVFEITETHYVSNPSDLKANMDDLIDYGFEFSLDDYGSGYSTIDYIVSLPFKTIKIDQRIIQKLATNEDSKKVVSYTVKMLHSIGKIVVAEGVDTEEIDDFISKLDIEYIQGFLYSKALSEEEFVEFIKNHQKQ